MEKPRNSLKAIFLVFLILLGTISIVQGIKNALTYPLGSVDFQYDSAKLVALGINPYDESLSPTGIAEQLNLTKFYSGVEANQFISMLVFLLPFTFFEPYIANILWAVFNLFLTGLMIVLARKLFFKNMTNYVYICLSCIMLAGLGWRGNIGIGQHTIFAFAFFLLALWLSEKKNFVLAGISLAASLFKYTLIVPLIFYMTYKKRYKEIFVAIGVHIVLMILGSWWIGESLINTIAKPLIVSSKLSAQGYLDIGSIFQLPSLTGMIVAGLICAAMFVLSLLSVNNKHGLLLYCIVSYVSLIVIYHRSYDFFILIIPVGILYLMCKSDKKWRLPFLISVGVFIYTNFIERALHLSIFPDWLQSDCKLIAAVSLYIYIVYLSVIFVIEYVNAHTKRKLENV